MIDLKKRENGSGKRKVLELEETGDTTNEMDIEPTEEVFDPSIDDLEFTLKTDASKLIRKSKSDFMTRSQINILKLIICSGLYPNIAIPDDSNLTRRSSEQFFHTKARKFVVMHPGSIYTIKPELLVPMSDSMYIYTLSVIYRSCFERK